MNSKMNYVKHSHWIVNLLVLIYTSQMWLKKTLKKPVQFVENQRLLLKACNRIVKHDFVDIITHQTCSRMHLDRDWVIAEKTLGNAGATTELLYANEVRDPQPVTFAIVVLRTSNRRPEASSITVRPARKRVQPVATSSKSIFRCAMATPRVDRVVSVSPVVVVLVLGSWRFFFSQTGFVRLTLALGNGTNVFCCPNGFLHVLLTSTAYPLGLPKQLGVAAL